MAKDYENGVLQTLQAALEKRKQEIHARAQQEIQRLQEAAEAQRKRIIDQRLQQLRREMAVHRARELGVAHREAREEILGAKYEVIQAIEARVRNQLDRLGREQWQEILRHWFRELLPYLRHTEGPVVIHVPRGMGALVQQEVRRHPELQQVQVQEVEDLERGVVLEDRERGFRVRNTLEDRLQRARTYMLERMATLLEQWEGKG